MPARSQRGILERLKSGPVLGAEGYVFELERRGYIKAGPYVPEVVLDAPDALRELHREFLRAGADVMVALTYYAHRGKLKDVGRENDLEAMNRQAVRIANEVAREGDALVAGDICNTWAYDPKNKEASSKVVRGMYEEQLSWAVDEGIDFVIAETNDYLGEALIALEVIKELKFPAMVTLASTRPHQNHAADHRAGSPPRQRVHRDATRSLQDRPGDADVRVVENGRGHERFPHRTRALPLHAVRDGRLRSAGAGAGRQLHRDLLWRKPTLRAFHRRGPGTNGSGQQVLARDRTPPGDRYPGGGERKGIPRRLEGLILNRANLVSALVTAFVGAIFLLLAFETWALFTGSKTITDYFRGAVHDVPGLVLVIAIVVGIVLGHFLWGPATGLLAPAPRKLRDLMSRRAAD